MRWGRDSRGPVGVDYTVCNVYSITGVHSTVRSHITQALPIVHGQLVIAVAVLVPSFSISAFGHVRESTRVE